jgi:chitinase
MILGFSNPQIASAQKKTVIAYYSGSLAAIDSFNAKNFTHIIYCFGRLNGNDLKIRGEKDTLLIQKMVAMKKQNKDLKVLLSLGGWGGCAPCSDVFSTARGREDFVRSVKSLTDYFGSDGIDLDWEYPTIEGFPGHRFVPEDKQNFTELIRLLRKELGKKSTITFAAGGFQKFIDQSVDWKAIMPLVDYVNLMTYDLVGGYSTVTGTILRCTALTNRRNQPTIV